jgi:hypothetical protein
VSSAIVEMVRAFARLSSSLDDEIALEAAKHINALREDVWFTANYSVLDDELYPGGAPEAIVDAGDAPYVPCDCPVCEGYEGGLGLDDLPGDDNFPLIFTSGVFRQ